MSKFGEIFQDLVIKTLKDSYQFVIQFAPKIVLSLIILLIGWVCALLLKKIISKLLKALGFDVLAEKIGLTNFLEKGGVQKKASSIFGLVFYWLIIFSALIMVFNALELEIASKLIQQTLIYIPKLIVALILLALGIFLSRFIGKFVQASARLTNIPFHTALGKIASYVIIGLAIMIGLEYLGLATAIIIHYAVIVFILVPLIIALIFLIGGKDIISNALASRMLKKEYKRGDIIEFGSISGQVDSIDLVSTKLKSKEGKIIIPNSELINKIVKKSGGEQNESS